MEAEEEEREGRREGEVRLKTWEEVKSNSLLSTLSKLWRRRRRFSWSSS